MTKALQYIEIDIEHCSLTYGVLPCTAHVEDSPPNSPPTGDHKCFNTIATCQDRANFTTETLTLRFAVATDYLPVTIECIPSIKEISFSPANVSLGTNLGQRASISVTFEDHRHSDTGLDKYLSERTYDPYQQGTFWGKFRARVPFLRGRNLRWINGTLGQALDEMETRYYVIDSYTGPSANGEYVIIAKDVLKLTDGERALAPTLTAGFLQSDITNSSTSITLSPTGTANNYDRSGYVAIGGSEIAAYLQQKGYDDDGTSPAAVTFDGSNDSLARGAVLTSIADGRSLTASFWIKRNSSASQSIYSDIASFFGDQLRFSITMDATNLRLLGVTSGAPGTTILDITTPLPTLSLWTNVLISFDLTNTARRHIYYNDVAQTLTVTTYTNNDINFNGSNTFIGITHLTSNRLNADLAEFWLEHNLYTDFSVEANRRLFISADIQPIKLGSTGQTPTGSSPDVFLANPAASWHTNLGTGGGFTLTGTLSAATFSGDAMLLTARGQLNTEAASHAAQDRVQEVLTYITQSPADIIADLLETYAGVDPTYIPLSEWQLECDTYLAQLYTAYIAQPTAVSDLVSELIQQAGLALWWDDRDQKIGLQVLRGSVALSQELNEDNYVAGSLQISEQPDTRISQVHTYYAQINPLVSLTDKSNYRSVETTIDEDAETDYGSAAIREIFSRWIPALGRSIATRLNTILLARYVDPPRRFKLQVLRGSVNELVLAGVYNLSAWPLQDDQGAPQAAAVQLTRQKPMADLIEVEGEEMLFEAPAVDLSNRVILYSTNTFNVNGRTAHDSVYPAASSGDHVTFIVAAGAIVGSTDATLPAFDVGTWASGVSITIQVLGRIQGHGGNGANYSAPGQAGGTAIYTRKAITLDAELGQVWGGGGGGGSTLAGASDGYGGSGGAGQLPGTAGNGFATGPNGLPGTTEHGGGLNGVFTPIGGEPGQAGANGNITNGGAAGNAIDGISFTSFMSPAGDIRGQRVN